MGVGFAQAVQHPFLSEMRAAAAQRTRDMVARVNAYMRPVELDYEKDVVPLTPKGNATERHLCEAFERKAGQVFPDAAQRAAFWKEKLGDAPPAGAKLQNLIRAKTMKKGGVGYVQPGKGSFPLMADMNRFVLESGAIPTLTWLDGTSEGEKSHRGTICQVAMASGAAALNIIPDRNYTPGVKDQKLKNLYDVVAMAEKHHFPVIVGTEMNSPGNKFVDSFEHGGTEAAGAGVPAWRAHRLCPFGFAAPERAWAISAPGPRRLLPTSAAKNEFFETPGTRAAARAAEDRLRGLTADATPDADSGEDRLNDYGNTKHSTETAGGAIGRTGPVAAQRIQAGLRARPAPGAGARRGRRPVLLRPETAQTVLRPRPQIAGDQRH